MHTEKEHIDPAELAAMKYERRDVNTKILGKTVVVFYVFALVSALFAAFILYWGVNLGPLRVDPYVERTTTQQKAEAENRAGRILPKYPYPLLQGNVTAKLDIQTMRQAEDQRLAGTGYADEAKTRAYIPISHAIDLLAERGLPKTGSEAAVSKGNDMEPFGTGTVTPPDRTGARGDPTIGTSPTNPPVSNPDQPTSSPAAPGVSESTSSTPRSSTPRPLEGAQRSNMTPAPPATQDPIPGNAH